MSAEGRGLYLGADDGLDVTEEGEQCIDCLRFGYDPHQDVCLICGHGQLRDHGYGEELDDDTDAAIPDTEHGYW